MMLTLNVDGAVSAPPPPPSNLSVRFQGGNINVASTSGTQSQWGNAIASGGVAPYKYSFSGSGSNNAGARGFVVQRSSNTDNTCDLAWSNLASSASVLVSNVGVTVTDATGATASDGGYGVTIRRS